jgi:integrase
LSDHGIYKLVREYGMEQGRRIWPHGLRHSAITQAVLASQADGISLLEVRQYSRHANVNQLVTYFDQTRDVQGHLAERVATAVDTPPAATAAPRRAPEAPLTPAERRRQFTTALAAAKAKYAKA